MDKILFASGNGEWITPRPLMAKIVDRFGEFDLDAAADERNTQAPEFLGVAQEALTQPWAAENVWLNPPYGAGLDKWVHKCAEEVLAKVARQVIALLPARTDTRWFAQAVAPFASEVYFVKGRIRFDHPCKDPPAVDEGGEVCARCERRLRLRRPKTRVETEGGHTVLVEGELEATHAPNSATFPSMLVVWRRGATGPPTLRVWE